MRINVDPRLFLSAQPSSLPPVPIEWFRDQTESEKQETFKAASAYLHKALTLNFGGTSFPLPECSFQPMDGSTNLPLSAATKEVHLLAEAVGRVPERISTFEAVLTQDAGVSMILLSSFEGEMERRPNVLFPGESSRPFKLPFVAEQPLAPEQPTTPAKPKLVEPSPPAGGIQAYPGMSLGLGALTLLLVLWGLLAWRRSKASGGPGI